MSRVPGYTIIIPIATLDRAATYLKAIQGGSAAAGDRLRDQLHGTKLSALTQLDLLGKLFDTKQPQIFAETAVFGNGSDWNLTELGLLGDISVAVPVTIFDDGDHTAPTPHDPPFEGTLVFTPGALLRNGRGHTPADWNDATTADGKLSTEGYYTLYRRRLLPVLHYINEHAPSSRSAFVTVPGLGCGQFAGPFRGALGSHLEQALKRLLLEHGESLPNLKCVYFDPYSECSNTRDEIHGIGFMVRPLQRTGNQGKSQLCRPVAYAENGDDFTACKFYSIVAWDHVSWPGNDFYAGARATDDGVKAAATDTLAALTGIQGQYDATLGKYQPPRPYERWGQLVGKAMRRGDLRLWNPDAVWRSAPPASPA